MFCAWAKYALKQSQKLTCHITQLPVTVNIPKKYGWSLQDRDVLIFTTVDDTSQHLKKKRTQARNYLSLCQEKLRTYGTASEIQQECGYIN